MSNLFKMNLLLGAGLLMISTRSADADNINTSGTVCQNFNAGQSGDIDYLANAVRNLNPAARLVICPLPRSPLVGTSQPLFFVDGQNFAGTTTTCTLFTYAFGGAITNSVTFTEAAGPSPWDHLVSFPVGSVPMFDYASVLCALPGSGNGTLLGITSIQ